MAGAGEGLEGLDSKAGEDSRLDTGSVEGWGAPMKFNWGCRLGSPVGTGVEKGRSVSKEVRKDLVVITGVEVESRVKAG